MGFFFMCLFWFWCWVVQPVKTGLLTPFGALLPNDNSMVARAKSYYETVVENMGCKFGWISKKMGLDPARLTTSVSFRPLAQVVVTIQTLHRYPTPFCMTVS